VPEKKPQSKPQSNRGGARPGAGRKTKVVTELRAALIAANAEPQIRPPIGAAEFALQLFDDTMRDEQKDLELRLDCAKEVLNRIVGKPRIAEAPSARDDGEGITIYIPDNGRESAAPESESTAS
jgi:hypothetical protein